MGIQDRKISRSKIFLNSDHIMVEHIKMIDLLLLCLAVTLLKHFLGTTGS